MSILRRCFALSVLLAMASFPAAFGQTTAYPLLQQQTLQMAGTGATGLAAQGKAVAISADGNTAVVGGPNDNSNAGGAWIFKRSGSSWTQQGSELIGTGAVGAAQQGTSVAISGDGTTVIVGGPADNSNAGAAWAFIFTSDGGWVQFGTKLVGTGAVGAAAQGTSVALSGDGTIAMVGGPSDNSNAGAAWVFTTNGLSWSQSGSKLVGAGATGAAQQGASVSLDAGGRYALVGGPADNSGVGAAWVWTKTETWVGHKITGTSNTGASAQGSSVAISGDAWVVAIGGPSDSSNAGAIWVFTRGSGTFTQQAKLTGSGESGASQLGSALAISRDGGVILGGGTADNSNNGAVWVFGRTGVASWEQQNSKYLASDAGPGAQFGSALGISADANTAIFGAANQTSGAGAIWAYNDDIFFGSVNVAANITQTIAIQPQSNFTIGNVLVTTQGFGSKDFTIAASQTAPHVCEIDAAISNELPTCSLTVQFAPTAPGVRMGAIQIFDDESDLEATVYVFGIGVGPQVGFFSALINTVAGNGTAGYSGDGGLATAAELSSPYGVSADPAGDLFIGDYGNCLVREVTASTGFISTIAGTPSSCGFSGDGGLATSAQMQGPDSPELDGAGNLDFMDYENYRVRVVSPNTAFINTYAGNGTPSHAGDGGLATSAEIDRAYSEMIANNGDVYIAENYGNTVRRVSAITGIITTVAGTGTAGYSGDGTPATTAELSFPVALAMDPSGNLYISDDDNSVIREVSYATGTINTVVGNSDNGGAGFSGDGGPASSAQLNDAEGLALDPAGDLYIADSSNNAVREVNVATQIINSIAGNGNLGDEDYTGDGGPATSALLAYPVFPGFDGHGNFYFSDSDNDVVRVIGGPPPLLFANTIAGEDSAPQDISVTNNGNANLSFSNLAITGDFSFAGPDATCTSSTTLIPGQSCVLSVIFAPMVSGTLTGDITITSNATPATQQIPLSGMGLVVPTTMTLNTSLSPADNGQSVTFTAQVGPAPIGSPLGTVAFCLGSLDGIANPAAATSAASGLRNPRAALALPHDGSSDPCGSATLLGTINIDSSGFAMFTTSSLPVGSDTITALYSGNAAYASAISNAVTEVINSKEFTSVSLTASPNPAGQGQSVTFTVSVSPVPTGSPLGSVDFCLGTLGSIAATSRSAALTASARRAPALTPVSSSNPCGIATLLGSINLDSSGVATFSSSALPLGSDLITAIYTGNSGFAAGISMGLTEVINTLVATTTALTVSPNPANAGQTVTFTAAVTPAPTGSPLGTITFCEGASEDSAISVRARAEAATRAGRLPTAAPRVESSPCGSGTALNAANVDSSGGATFTDSSLSSGSLVFVAVYSGNASSNSSISPNVTEAINPAYTVTAPPGPVDVAEGGSVAITVTVPPLGGSYNNSVTLTASGLPNGATASFDPAAVTPGSTGAQTTMTVSLAGAKSTTSAVGAPIAITAGRLALLLAYVLALGGIFVAAFCRGAQRRLATIVLLSAACVGATWMLSACSGGFLGAPITPKGSYVITITGTSGSLSPSTTVTLVVQ